MNSKTFFRGGSLGEQIDRVLNAIWEVLQGWGVQRARLLIERSDPKFRAIFGRIERLHDNPGQRVKQVKDILFNFVTGIMWSNGGAFLGIFFAVCAVTYVIPLAIIEHIPEEIFCLGVHVEDTWLLKEVLVLMSIPIVTVLNVRNILPALLGWNIKRVIRYLPPGEYAEVFLNSLSGSQMLTFLACEYLWLCEGFDDFLAKSPVFSKMIDCYPNANDQLFLVKMSRYKAELSQWLKDGSALEALEAAKDYQRSLEVEVMKCVALQKLLIERAMVQERELLHHILKFSTDLLVARVDGLIHDLESIVPRSKDASQYAPGDQDRTALHSCIVKARQMQLEFQTKRIPRLESILLWDDLHETIMGMASLASTAWSFGNFKSKLLELGNDLLDSQFDLRKSAAYLARMWTMLSSSKAHFGIDMMIHIEKFCEVRGLTPEVIEMLPLILREIKTLDSVDQRILSAESISNERRSRYLVLAGYLNRLEEESADIVAGASNMLGENFSRELQRVLKIMGEVGQMYLVVFGYSATVLKCMEEVGSILKDSGSRVFLFGEANYGNFNTKLMRYEMHNLSKDLQSVSTFIGSDEFFLSLINPGDSVLLLAGTEVFDLSMQRLFHTTGCQSRLENFVSHVQAKVGVHFETWVMASDYKVYQSFPEPSSEFGEEFFRDHYWRMEVFDMKLFPIDNLLITNGYVYENGRKRDSVTP